MNLAPHENNDNNNDNTIAEIDSPYSSIEYFVEFYNTNPQFKNYLLVGLIKAAVVKITRMSNL